MSGNGDYPLSLTFVFRSWIYTEETVHLMCLLFFIRSTQFGFSYDSRDINVFCSHEFNVRPK